MNIKRATIAVAALLLMLSLALFPAARQHVGLLASTFLFGLTILQTAQPNTSPPVNSYSANVAALAGDASPITIPLPAALAAKMANYGGTGIPIAVTALEFYFTRISGGAGVTNYAISYASGSNSLQLAFTQPGTAVAFTCWVKVAIPSTNNVA